jgi:hypothetical protein
MTYLQYIYHFSITLINVILVPPKKYRKWLTQTYTDVKKILKDF